MTRGCLVSVLSDVGVVFLELWRVESLSLPVLATADGYKLTVFQTMGHRKDAVDRRWLESLVTSL